MRLCFWLLLGFVLFTTPCNADELPDDWAFKPVTRPVPPTAGNAVDAFVSNSLKKHELRYAPEAEKRMLLRRVTFDLTGLPPTPKEIAAFENDSSRDAYGKVVDRLLSSPRFGERAALFWLDVVRYAESDGFKSDDARPHAWRYRDYVIQSFNADKPYDRFLSEQLAGDELFPNNSEALIATGFLRHAPYEYNAVNLEQRRQDLLNDITDTTSSTFLGLTLGCAKCHDHKTDPITQEDYYRLQSFFAGYSIVDQPLLTAEQRAELERRKTDWEQKTEDLRQEMAELEKPFREAGRAKERSRFPEEYARLLDISYEKRTPFEKQIGYMIDKQMTAERRFNSSQMKGTVKEKWDGMSKRMAEFAKEIPPEPPTAMTMTDLGTIPAPTRLLKRGNVNKPGEEMTPGFLSAFDDRDADVTATATTTGRRSALAKWIASTDNPLTARVAVNRIWQQLFGRGIVATPGDFGVTGEKPTHPELLDWLAAELMAKKWSMKAIYRQVATSAAYKQTSIADHGLKADPDNKLLWRMPRKRLDGEAVRDAMLAVSGQLNFKAGGPSVYPDLPEELRKSATNWKPSEDPADRNRRSIYVAVKRNLRYPLFALFDSPDRNEVCARRFVTTTAPQALTLLNDGSILANAKQFATKVTKESGEDHAAIIEQLFLKALGRTPDTEEQTAASNFLDRHKGPEADAVADLSHSILNLNEFLYID